VVVVVVVVVAVVVRPQHAECDALRMYINGHSDVMAGAVCAAADTIALIQNHQILYGGCLSG
jgi:cystathionine beta-lyase/cystathionine gamma-synthase